MQAATLPWITFLDADDEMLPESISTKVAYLMECPDPDGVTAVDGSFVRSETWKGEKFAETRDQVDPDDIGRAGGFPGGVPSYIFRRVDLLAAGSFRTDLIMFEDFELILRLIARGGRVVGCNAPGFYRNFTPNSLSRGTPLLKCLWCERHFLQIAAQHGLMSRPEIARRRLRNLARLLFNRVTGR